MVDRVRPLKFEDAATGGTETDQFPTSLDPHEDYVDVRGVTVQNATSADDVVRIERDVSNNMIFIDPLAGTKTLTQLAAGGGGGLDETAHAAVDQLVHNLSETHEQIPSFSADGIMTSVVAQGVGGGVVIRDFDQMTADADGLVLTGRLRQRNGAGTVVETLSASVTVVGGIPTKNTVTKT